jgi:hypothetical protein
MQITCKTRLIVGAGAGASFARRFKRDGGLDEPGAARTARPGVQAAARRGKTQFGRAKWHV